MHTRVGTPRPETQVSPWENSPTGAVCRRSSRIRKKMSAPHSVYFVLLPGLFALCILLYLWNLALDLTINFRECLVNPGVDGKLAQPAPYAGGVQGILYPQLSLVRCMPCGDSILLLFWALCMMHLHLLVLLYLEISDLT